MASPVYNDSPKSFKEALDTGLRRGINTFIQDKMSSIADRNSYQPISDRIQKLGVTPEVADYLATLPPQHQVPLLQSYFQGNQQAQEVPGQGNIESQGQPTNPQPLSLDKETRKQQEQMRREEVRRGEQLRKEKIAEQHKSDKETFPYYTQLKKEAKSSRDNLKRLDRMEQLIKKGNLPTAGWANALDGFSKIIWGHGINLKHLYHADAQEFEKLSNDFIKGAKDIFGARLTDADLKAFMSTIPTLSLSNEGKIRVINNLRYANEASNIRDKIAEEIIRSNGGKRPSNIESLVEEMAAPELDRLADKFKESNLPLVEESAPFQLGGKPGWTRK